MANWRKTIHLKQYLDQDESAESIKKAATGIIGVVKPLGGPTEKMQKAHDMADADPEVALLVFNDAMNKVYDWADANLIWVA